MKNIKIKLSYIVFAILLVGVFTLFSGEVDAAKCIYSTSGINGSANIQLTLKTKDRFEDNAVLVIDTSQSHTITFSSTVSADNKGSVKDITKKDGYDLHLIGKSCPTITLYPSGLFNTANYIVYESKQQCEDKHYILGCDGDGIFHNVTGTLIYEDGEESQLEQCSASQQTYYETEEEKLFDNYRITFDEQISNIEQYKSNYVVTKNYVATRIKADLQKYVNNVINANTIYNNEVEKLKNEINCAVDATKITDRTVAIKFDKERLDEKIKDFFEDYKQRLQQDGLYSKLPQINEIQNEMLNYVGEKGDEMEENTEIISPGTSEDNVEQLEGNCELLDSIDEHLQEVFDWIKIIAPILLIVFGSIEFGKAVISSDNDALKKATNNFIKRTIATITIFFLPLIINLLLHLPGIEMALSDALCGISKVVLK